MSMLSRPARSPLYFTGWLLAAALFAWRLLPGLVQPGMFFDGVTHATIARNLAIGVGDVWHPVFSQADGAGYHEQPPLAFLLESFFFRVCGDHFWVEKVYSALTGLVTAGLIAAIWRRLVGRSVGAGGRPAVGGTAGSGDPRRTLNVDAAAGDSRGTLRDCDWLPVALWIALPGWGWMFENNLLENTLGLFAVLAVYALLRADEGGRAAPAWLVTGAAAIAAAVLSKGPVGLYPLVTPLIAHFTLRRQSFLRAVARNAALVVLVGAAFGSVSLLPGAVEYGNKYLHEQLFASLQGQREVVSSVLGRFDILWKMSRELILPVAVAAGLIWLARRSERNRAASGAVAVNPESQRQFLIPEHKRLIAFCLVTAASASLPIMASPKQSGHYAFPSYAFYALAIAFWCAPAVLQLLTTAGAAASLERWHRRLQYAAVATLALLVVASCLMAGRPHKDKDAYLDTLVLGQLLPKSTVVSLSADLATDFPLQTNLARWDFIAADRATLQHEYLLAPIAAAGAAAPGDYVEVRTQMSHYRLFKRTAIVESTTDEPAPATAAGNPVERTRSRN